MGNDLFLSFMISLHVSAEMPIKDVDMAYWALFWYVVLSSASWSSYVAIQTDFHMFSEVSCAYLNPTLFAGFLWALSHQLINYQIKNIH